MYICIDDLLTLEFTANYNSRLPALRHEDSWHESQQTRDDLDQLMANKSINQIISVKES